MSNHEYLIVHTKILPAYLEKVIEARNMLNSKEADSVTEAVRRVGISRNTYYKYKDVVFVPSNPTSSRKANISVVLKDEAGSLSAVLQTVSTASISVITISQSLPVAQSATVTMSLDFANSTTSTEELIEQLRKIPQAISVHLDAME